AAGRAGVSGPHALSPPLDRTPTVCGCTMKGVRQIDAIADQSAPIDMVAKAVDRQQARYRGQCGNTLALVEEHTGAKPIDVRASRHNALVEGIICREDP